MTKSNTSSSSLLFIALAVIVAHTAAQTPCFARITASPRASSSWTDGTTTYQVWDITATNEGTCALTRVVGFFSAGPGRITEGWNYDISSGLITGYGDALRVGESYTGAGFVLANSSSPTLALDRPGCDESCSANPTSAPPATDAPTSSPVTSEPTTAPTGGCAVNALVYRDGDAWTDAQGRNTSVYRVSITNQGPCALATYVLSFAYYPGTLVSTWNLESTLGGYKVQGYGETLAAGMTYTGAGLIISGAPEEVGANGYGSVCAC